MGWKSLGELKAQRNVFWLLSDCSIWQADFLPWRQAVKSTLRLCTKPALQCSPLPDSVAVAQPCFQSFPLMQIQGNQALKKYLLLNKKGEYCKGSPDNDFLRKQCCERGVCVFPNPFAFVSWWICDWFLKQRMLLWKHFKIHCYFYVYASIYIIYIHTQRYTSLYIYSRALGL